MQYCYRRSRRWQWSYLFYLSRRGAGIPPDPSPRLRHGGVCITYTVMPFRLHNASTFYTLQIRIIQDEATTLFRLLCIELPVNLQQNESLQPNFIVSNLPKTDHFKKSCTAQFLSLLEIDTTYTQSNISSALSASNLKNSNFSDGNFTVRQKMRNSNNYHLMDSRVIIDDTMLRSTK